ncbi:MAG: hypothetical protein EOP81_04855 [Variovorax sp.]|nr:MAG: hypothetical protein EOP81_04855 [Variovorax sp.]
MTFRPLRSFFAVTTLAACSVVTPLAMAQAPGTAARMQAEKAVCDGVQQDRAACLREAGAARQEAGRNGLTGASPAGYDANAMARCQLQPVAERADCEARLQGSTTPGASTSTSGSVMGGGVIRETVTPIPAPAR